MAEGYQGTQTQSYSTNGAPSPQTTHIAPDQFRKVTRDTKNEVGDVNVVRVYVCHLPYSYTSADITKMFSPFGKIIESKVLVDPRTGKSRGVAFIHYERKEDAQSAITAINGTKLDNHHQTLQARFAKVTTERGKDRPRAERRRERPRRDPYERERSRDRERDRASPRRRPPRRRDYEEYDEYDEYDDRRPRSAGIHGSGYYDREKNRGGYTLYTAPSNSSSNSRPPPPPPISGGPPIQTSYPGSGYPPSNSSYPPSSLPSSSSHYQSSYQTNEYNPYPGRPSYQNY